jgi:hypothetical protein
MILPEGVSIEEYLAHQSALPTISGEPDRLSKEDDTPCDTSTADIKDKQLPDKGETSTDSNSNPSLLHSASLDDTKGSLDSSPQYPGDYNKSGEGEEEPEGGYKTLTEFSTLDFPNPAFLVSFFNQSIADGETTLHSWQVQVSEDLASLQHKPTSQHPLKYCLVAANGSGKDIFIVAPFAIWFALTKKRSRVIITSASGTQLTAQTESYIKDLAEKVNAFFGTVIFKIRQRYIRCLLSGSEIRMFATDEEGKAEGYHPIEPGAEMAIIVNEGKSVSEEIHKALGRCSGYNYWLEISSPGEDKGDLFYAFNRWKNAKRITSFDCPHISKDEIEEDKLKYGETSAYYRSKHLALFTTLGGNVIIPREIVDRLIALPPTLTFKGTNWPKRYGIDLSAGGDELVIAETQGNKQTDEVTWRERDTTISADRIHTYLRSKGLPYDYNYIFADDGGVGHAIIDMLVRKGWTNIHRIHNQSPAFNRKHYGNRGAENYDRVKRLFEENIWNPTGMSTLCLKQLTNRKIKENLSSPKIFLQPKSEAKANGFESPDRADAFILSLVGLTIEDFTDGKETDAPKIAKKRFTSEEIEQHYEDVYTFGNIDKQGNKDGKRIYGSLSLAIKNGEDNEIEFNGEHTNN